MPFSVPTTSCHQAPLPSLLFSAPGFANQIIELPGRFVVYSPLLDLRDDATCCGLRLQFGFSCVLLRVENAMFAQTWKAPPFQSNHSRFIDSSGCPVVPIFHLSLFLDTWRHFVVLPVVRCANRSLRSSRPLPHQANQYADAFATALPLYRWFVPIALPCSCRSLERVVRRVPPPRLPSPNPGMLLVFPLSLN